MNPAERDQPPPSARARVSRRGEPSVTFLGAAECVTGSRFLVEGRSTRVLVDCGLFQGTKKLRRRNWAPLPVAPNSVDAIVLTHAHLDHSGLVPRLVARGFEGPVYCTEGSAALLEILWPDAAHLQEADARRASRRGYTRHRPALPLFDIEDAERALRRLRPRRFHQSIELGPDARASFSPAGHILGAACVRVELGEVSVTFSGDVGGPHDPIMRPPAPLQPTDWLITESTYGDRLHPRDASRAELAEIVRRTVANGGSVLIPAFAVGRTQQILHALFELRRDGAIPEVPTYVDSPMATSATEALAAHADEHRLDHQTWAEICGQTSFTRTTESSKAIANRPGSAIIISASGMLTGGRVLHHLRRLLPHPENSIVLVGHQADGTRGRALLEGSKEIKVHGEYIPVHAWVRRIDGLSAHADHRELLDWIAASAISPRGVFVVHGEPGPADALRRRLEERFGWEVTVPEFKERFSLRTGAPLHGPASADLGARERG